MQHPIHLHERDYPATLAILHALFADRLTVAAAFGYQPAPSGAVVNWGGLEHWRLSASETAAIEVARGVSRLEAQHAVFPARLADAVYDAVVALTPNRSSASSRAELHP